VNLFNSRLISSFSFCIVTVPSLADWEKEWGKNSQRNAQPKLLPVDFFSKRQLLAHRFFVVHFVYLAELPIESNTNEIGVASVAPFNSAE
jgi:hypothetical protein